MIIAEHELGPEYLAAVKLENDVRDAAFLELTTDICGIKIRQMRPRDLLILDGTDNPMVDKGAPTPEQLRDFLWKLSPDYRRSAFHRIHFWFRTLKFYRLKFYFQAVEKCWRYIDSTFQDSPGRSSGSRSRPYAGWCAHMVNTISTAYGWDDEKVLKTPLVRLWQYVNCIRKSNDPDFTPFNASDKLKREAALRVYREKNSN